jgi:hypothetical protein
MEPVEQIACQTFAQILKFKRDMSVCFQLEGTNNQIYRLKKYTNW